ncbi:hypothetical protein [Vallitalea guaymasensis]|uniref:hypothetical protein n=1 Tax=Vallitalea guaymasensis TaxID=1185412 RepID=UPI000DE530DF|nr:hypothetical protein [Vallitalea guaymasensis]
MGILLAESSTFDFGFVTDWVTGLVGSLTGSSKTVLLAGLGLLGLIIGAFFLIGLGKKLSRNLSNIIISPLFGGDI